MSQVLMMPAAAAGFYSLFGRVEKAAGDTLNLPTGMVNLGGNGKGYLLAAASEWDPTDSENHDGTVSGLSLGDDVYLYAVPDDSGYAKWLASKNATTPDGHSSQDSRKMGGFHYGRVRAIAQAYDAGATLSVEIIANSCWDLGHRPKCDPSGMVEVVPDALWVDIYLASEGPGSWPDTVPESRYDAVPLSGSDGYSRYYDYTRLARNAGKRLPSYSEFVALAYGVPQGATDAGGRVNTGQHGDYGFECVSCLNVDQPSGNLLQQSIHIFDRNTSNSWSDLLNEGKDSAHDHGQINQDSARTATLGGHWTRGAEAGARCVDLDSTPWTVLSGTGLRAVCDSL